MVVHTALVVVRTVLAEGNTGPGEVHAGLGVDHTGPEDCTGPERCTGLVGDTGLVVDTDPDQQGTELWEDKLPLSWSKLFTDFPDRSQSAVKLSSYFFEAMC